MTKSEWGTKRLCLSCGARFYDLRRDPITCPKCGTLFVPEPPAKSRRAAAPKPAAQAAVVPPPAVEKVVADEDTAVAGADDLKAAGTDDEDDESNSLIEDASELGEDEDDMAEVIESSHKATDDR